jgi:hypothetical protein
MTAMSEEKRIQKMMHEWYGLVLLRERGVTYAHGAAAQRIALLERQMDAAWAEHEKEAS